jgi:hypothetical protein
VPQAANIPSIALSGRDIGLPSGVSRGSAYVLFNQCEKRSKIERLGNVVITPSFEDSFPITCHCEGRNRDNRDRVRLPVSLEPTGHFGTRDIRQLNVQQNQIRKMLAGQSESICPQASHHSQIAPSIEDVLQELEIQLIVLDY